MSDSVEGEQVVLMEKDSVSKRRKLTLGDKERVVRLLEQGKSQRQISAQLGISKASVARASKQRDEILRASTLGNKDSRARIRRDTPLNLLVKRWYDLALENKLIVSGPLLQLKAIQFNKALGLNENFTASQGWLESFKNRYNIVLSGNKASGAERKRSFFKVPMCPEEIFTAVLEEYSRSSAVEGSPLAKEEGNDIEGEMGESSVVFPMFESSLLRNESRDEVFVTDSLLPADFQPSTLFSSLEGSTCDLDSK
jgi:hypothetical protein